MKKTLLKDDFFSHINKVWLENTKIPEDKSSISVFSELDLNLEKLLKDLTKKWLKDTSSLNENSMMLEYVKYFSMLMNESKRKELGWEPVKQYLTKLESLKSFKDLFSQDKEFWLLYGFLPLEKDLYEDFIDNEKRIFWFGDFKTILPNKESYSNKEESEKLLNTWKEMVLFLLKDYGKTEEEANKLISNAIKFDDIYKDYILSSIEQANYVALYNLKTKDEYNLYTKQFVISDLLESLVSQKVEAVSVSNIRLYENFDKIFSNENFEFYKSFLFIRNLLQTTKFLSEEIRIKAGEFGRKVYSIETYRNLENFAFDIANEYFGMPLGMYYAENYFGKKAKENIEHMVSNMINVYKMRLNNNTWLSKETIQKALTKLSTIQVMIGFPEVIRPYYSKFKVKTYEEGGNLFENALKFNKYLVEYALSLFGKTEDKRYWSMSPATVNAYYNPLKNQIVFPAAILADPFYNLNRPSSYNYGSIGCVIAHEISHGFDNHGAQFDEKGKLNNWWTDKDREEFAKRTQATINLFDKVETDFGPVNGELTVSENIADLGGFDCALEAAKQEKDFDAKNFFESWATSWRIILKEGAAKRQLESDVHSPGKVRANVILGNNDLFLETYEISSSDKMFISKEKRVKIW
ncbi:M13 family metallopeptidase [Mycoplasma sp. Z386]